MTVPNKLVEAAAEALHMFCEGFPPVAAVMQPVIRGGQP